MEMCQHDEMLQELLHTLQVSEEEEGKHCFKPICQIRHFDNAETEHPFIDQPQSST